jgi:hypothetical protein
MAVQAPGSAKYVLLSTCGTRPLAVVKYFSPSRRLSNSWDKICPQRLDADRSGGQKITPHTSRHTRG